MLLFIDLERRSNDSLSEQLVCLNRASSISTQLWFIALFHFPFQSECSQRAATILPMAATILASSAGSLLSVVMLFMAFYLNLSVYYFIIIAAILSYHLTGWMRRWKRGKHLNNFFLCAPRHELHYNNFPSPSSPFRFVVSLYIWKLKSSAYIFHFTSPPFVLLLGELYLLSFECFLLLKLRAGEAQRASPFLAFFY